MFWLGRAAFRGLRGIANRPRKQFGPQYVKPYRGRYRKTYKTTFFLTIAVPLTVLGVILIRLCLAKYGVH